MLMLQGMEEMESSFTPTTSSSSSFRDRGEEESDSFDTRSSGEVLSLSPLKSLSDDLDLAASGSSTVKHGSPIRLRSGSGTLDCESHPDAMDSSSVAKGRVSYSPFNNSTNLPFCSALLADKLLSDEFVAFRLHCASSVASNRLGMDSQR